MSRQRCQLLWAERAKLLAFAHRKTLWCLHRPIPAVCVAASFQGLTDTIAQPIEPFVPALRIPPHPSPAMSCNPRRMIGLSLATAALLLGMAQPSLLAAPAQAPALAASPAVPKALFIEIIEGEGEVNDIRARTAREPIVEVQDENHRPVAGALVLFAADPSGGTRLVNFSGSPSISVRTGADGRATANGFRTTKNTGEVRILVKAVLGSVTAEAVLHQRNIASANRLQRSLTSHPRLLAAAAGAGAVAIVVVLLTRKDGTTIQAGTGVVRGIVLRH